MYIKGRMKTKQDDLSDIVYIREKVFQEELHIPKSLEEDDNDKNAEFAVVYKVVDSPQGENEKPVATGRLIVDADGNYKIGRIAVLPEERGNQYGDMIVKMLINKAFTIGANEVYVGAQTHAIGFYEKMGFVSTGVEYNELGRKHLKMFIKSTATLRECKNV